MPQACYKHPQIQIIISCDSHTVITDVTSLWYYPYAQIIRS